MSHDVCDSHMMSHDVCDSLREVFWKLQKAKCSNIFLNGEKLFASRQNYKFLTTKLYKTQQLLLQRKTKNLLGGDRCDSYRYLAI